MIYLKEFDSKNIYKQYKTLRRLPSTNGFINDYYKVRYSKFKKEELIRIINNSSKSNILNNEVPETYYLLLDDKKIVGLFKIRHYLNEGWKNGGGHIGYAILAKYQGLGYGKVGLKLAIEKLKSLEDFKEEEIYLACLNDNIASINIILSNNGYIHHKDSKKTYFRIPLK